MLNGQIHRFAAHSGCVFDDFTLGVCAVLMLLYTCSVEEVLAFNIQRKAFMLSTGPKDGKRVLYRLLRPV